MRYFFYAFLWVASTVHATSTEIFPSHCKPIALHGAVATLNPGKPRLIMLHNLSETDVWLATSELSTQLSPNHWSGLVIDEQALTLNCIESKPGHEQAVACEAVLGACEWTPTQKPESKHAVFWAAENMLLQPLIAYLGRIGFELPQTA